MFSQRKELDQGETLETRIMKHFQKGGTIFEQAVPSLLVILGFTLRPCGKKYFFYRLWAWNKVDRKQELGNFLSPGNVGRPDHRSLGEGPGPHYSSQSQDQTMEARETCTLEEGAAPKGRLPGAECTDPIPPPNLCWPGLSKHSLP